MQFLTSTLKYILASILQKPGLAAGVVVFGLGFTLVAGNALYAQKESHPDPIWSTEKQQDSLTQLAQPDLSVVNQPSTITRSVLTQRISLKNVPVPKANPARNRIVASQSTLVRDVQQSLAAIGYYEGKVDGIYGSGTRTAIMKFQSRSGIIPNGDVSYDLLNDLKSVQAVTGNQNASAKPAVVKQDKQPNASASLDAQTITRVQAGLKENFGIENISVDGVMGNQTRNAIRDFQEQFELEPTGELNEATMSKMKSVGVLASI